MSLSSRNLFATLVFATLALLTSAATASAESVVFPRLESAPTLEEFLEMAPSTDTARSMAQVEGFVQRHPRDGEPATQETVVYLGYDATHLHVVFVAFDREPRKVRAHMTQRENFVGDDLVTVWLDTFRDQRRAYVFQANAYGVQGDALYTEGQGFDVSFDTVWQSRGELTDRGYVVQMSIPFKSLRFAPTPEQTWGVIFSRSIQRGQVEEIYWPEVSNRLEGRLNQAAVATGLADLSPGRNMQVIPYVTARSFKLLEDGDDGARFVDDDEADAGFDGKVVVHDRWVIDATLNPDFSQVESDEPQVTVNQRFEVFFPERRPFFIENASYFRTPISLLFTRRIADPSLGVRLTGKAGRYAVGLLAIDDEAPGQRVAPDDPLAGKNAGFGVLRVTRDVGAQSSVGMIYAGREIGSGSNQVAGIDGRFKLSDHWVATFQAATSSTRGQDGAEIDDEAYVFLMNRSGRKFNYSGQYRDFGPDFRADAGFVPRVDFREVFHFMSYSFRPEGERLIVWGPEFEVRRVWDHRGVRLDDEIEGSLEWNFTGSTEIEINYESRRERLRPGDVPGLARDLDFDLESWELEYGTAFIDAFAINGELGWGRTVHFTPPVGQEPSRADFVQSELDLALRPLTRLKIDNTSLWTELSTSAGERIFRQHLLRSRWSWQFTRRASLRVILQYETLSADARLTRLESRKSLNGDVLFTYRINPWRALFVGYNGNYQDLEFVDVEGRPRLARTGSALLNDARQVFVKYSHLIRF